MVSDRPDMTTGEIPEEAFPFDEFDALDEAGETLGNEYVSYHGALQHTSQAYQYTKKKRQLRQKRATAFWKIG